MEKHLCVQDLYDFIGSELLAKGKGDMAVVLPWMDLTLDEVYNQKADTMEIGKKVILDTGDELDEALIIT